MKSLSKFSFLYFTIFLVASCAPFTSGKIFNNFNPNASESGDPSTIGSSTTIGNPAEDDPIIDGSGTLAYSPDANENVPVAGSVSTTNLSSGDQIAVSAYSISDVSILMDVNRSNKNVWAQFFESTIPAAQADTSADICAQDGVTCCPIETDGSFVCYLPLTDQSVTQVHLAVVSSDGTTMGDDDTETVQSSLKWLAAEPTDVTVAGDDVYAVTNGVAVKTTLSDDQYSVNGSYFADTGAYGAFSVSGTKISYDSGSEYFGVLDSVRGVSTLDSVGNILYGPITVDGATAYTLIKNTTYNKIYFGTELTTSTSASIYYYYENTTDDTERRINNNIEFIAEGDTGYSSVAESDTTLVQLTHDKTLAFDVNSSGYALVAYQDQAGNLRVRASNGETRFGGETPLSYSEHTPNIRDLRFVNDNIALMVDAANDAVWVIRLNTTARTVTSTLVRSSNSVSVGEQPEKLVFNSDKSKAYVLNTTGESITVISLHNSDNSVRTLPLSLATINFSDLVPGKSLTFTPVSMDLVDDTLFVACQGTKSLLQIDTASISETSVSDELSTWYQDSDNDGYGNPSISLSSVTQPTGYVSNSDDCSDSDANTYTGATELCDSIDNDCNGEVDNSVATVTWYLDADGDGYGANYRVIYSSEIQVGYVRIDGDCDDRNASVNPGAVELEDDRIDNNCNGSLDEIIFEDECDGCIDGDVFDTGDGGSRT